MLCKTDPSDTLFWDTVFSMDITSAEGLSTIAALLHSPSKIIDARNLRGDQAQSLIDLIDLFLTLPCLDERLSRRASQLLYKLCRSRRMLPASHAICPDLSHVGELEWAGGFADVSKGEYRGRPVAVKHLRIGTKDDSDKVFKQLCREVLIWKRLSHPNVLPLLGVSVSENPRHFRIVSEWMANGNVMEYIKSNPEANRLRLLSEATSGITYLHDLRVAHGDIKGANILIDHMGTARIGDFGLMIMTELTTILLSNTAIASCGTTRWMSPELLDPVHFRSDGLPSRQSDCYALGMAIYEVLSGHFPFHHLRSPVVAGAILRGERPEEPPNASILGFTNALWGLLRLCWSESVSARPTARQLLDHLRLASLNWIPPPMPCPAAAVGKVASSLSSDIFRVSGGSLSNPACRVQ